MLVVAIASQKGGSGKTTLCGHLAVEAEKSGAGPVALIDTDPQGSLSQWWNARAAKSPSFAKVGAFELSSALAHLQRTGIKIAIIDTPPAITDSISQVIALCDLVLVPTRPSPHDLRAVGATVDIAERYRKPLIFVMNGATARARITGESAVALSQHGTVAPSTIHHRVDFAASMVDGRTVGEVVPKSASTKEISDLWIYVQDRLARLVKDPALAIESRPEHFAVSALSMPKDEAELLDAAAEDLPMPVAPMHAPASMPPMPEFATVEVQAPTLPYLGPDRRMTKERREPGMRGQTLFNGADRRANPFGRRHTD
jgi:chromosome partitioning protein